MNYWDNPKYFEERNKKVYEDKQKGLSILDMSIKYQLSSSRVLSIIKRERERK